jgi:hypothetical protein
MIKRLIKWLLIPKAKAGDNILEIMPTVRTTMPDVHMNFNQWAQHTHQLIHKTFCNEK